MTQALLVVDIDGNNGWGKEKIAGDGTRQRIASAIKAVVEEARNKKKIIVFVVLPYLEDPNTHIKFLGQEAQLTRKVPTSDSAEKFENGAGCLGCDNGLAEFLGHRHGDCFEPVFLKMADNAFTNRGLAPFLLENHVTEIILVGCYASICVQETAIGAVKNGFNVTLLENCVDPPFVEKESGEWVRCVKDRSRRRGPKPSSIVRVVTQAPF